MSKLREQVKEFMQRAGQATPDAPRYIPKEVLYLRARLILEEVFEFCEAVNPKEARQLEELHHMARSVMWESVSRYSPNMVEMADALADIDYVVEGARLALGIDGGPIADEVHRANMSKVTSKPTLDEAGKITKPSGYTPPDIANVLRKQGWPFEPPQYTPGDNR